MLGFGEALRERGSFVLYSKSYIVNLIQLVLSPCVRHCRVPRQLISAQAQKIAELASGKQSMGVEEFKDDPPCDEGVKQFSDPAPTIEARVNPGMSDVNSVEGDNVHGMDTKEQEEREELVESWRDARSSEEEEAVREIDGEGVVDRASGAIGGIAFTR